MSPKPLPLGCRLDGVAEGDVVLPPPHHARGAENADLDSFVLSAVQDVL